MKLSVQHNIVKTNPGQSSNDRAPVGIAYLASFDNYLIVNNIDHNTEISQPRNESLHPIAIYNQTIYPDEPGNAGFDLDIHAAFYHPNQKSLSLLNHYGHLRFFDAGSLHTRAEPIELIASANAFWVADTAQCLLVNDCLISTSPGGYHVQSPASPGLFVSSPLSIALSQLKQNTNEAAPLLEYSVYFADMGNVSAIAINTSENLLAVAVGQNLIIVQINKLKMKGLSMGNIIAQFKTDFHCAFLSFCEENLIAAGHDIKFEENIFNPSQLQGGGFMVINVPNREILSYVPFSQNLAWGNGALCLTVVDSQNIFAAAAGFKRINDDPLIMGLDRHANLWAWQYNDANPKSLVLNELSDDKANYGIGHLAWHGQRLFCGFNRDNARLHSYEVTAV